ncbi:MAG: metal-sensitive transcriptional regulator [Candidatus Kerfeldbacteria bacterium]|nr:metal-sensitive transcriptional regulator [Candidatus Kerfeldbacteria bacterium]
MHDHQAPQQKILHRVRILQGHLRAVEQMIRENAYCVDIIHQSMAIQKALKRLDMVLMKNHLEGCVVDQIQQGKQEKSIKELLRLYEMK